MSDILPVIFCMGYNRPESLERLLKSVGEACYEDNNIRLIISIDRADDDNLRKAVKSIAESFVWKYGIKQIICHDERIGLKKHAILSGNFSEEYDAVICLEDDTVVGPGFYRFVKYAANYYKDDERLIGVALYSQQWVSEFQSNFVPSYDGNDIYFFSGDISHGQCWLKKGWRKFHRWYEKNENNLSIYDGRVRRSVYQYNTDTSWSKYMSFYLADSHAYFAVPYNSYATNLSEIGVHAVATTDICQVALSMSKKKFFQLPNIEEGVRYDSFFEREFEALKIFGISIKDICMDLNGIKYDYSNYRYLLSSKKLKYKSIYSFGINMEPIENNILYNVPGKAIHLYLLPDEYKPPETIALISETYISSDRLFHLFARINAVNLIHILLKKICNRIKINFYKGKVS